MFLLTWGAVNTID